MSLSFNQVNLCGTLTRDAEIGYTPKGTAVAKFSLAINRVYKDGDGKKHEECDFIDCEAWGKTAEIIGEWTAKGHTIFIEGRLKLDQWTDKESGKKRSKIKVVTEKMHFVSKPKGAEKDDEQGEGEEESAMRPPNKKTRREEPPKKSKKPPRDPDLDEPEMDDIPF